MKSLLVRVLATTALAPFLFSAHLSAAIPQLVVETVLFQASSPVVPHPSWVGNPVTLKGTVTSTFPGVIGVDNITYTWSTGDPLVPAPASCVNQPVTAANQYNLGCKITYLTNSPSITAILTVTDITNPSYDPPSYNPPTTPPGYNCGPVAGSACYYTSTNNAAPFNLPIEVDNAIDNGLWYIHTTMVRGTAALGSPIGNWNQGNGDDDDTSQADTGTNSLYCTTFEVNGFLTTNTLPNPYSADVALCLNGIFDQMTTRTMGSITPAGFATFTPDFNGNGIGIEAKAPSSGDSNYQTGMQMDSIAGAGTPTALVPTGTNVGHLAAGKGTGPGGAYTFRDAVVDGVDDYSYCESLSGGSGFDGDDGGTTGGGWHYSCQYPTGDNSVSQWAAIGIIPARRQFYPTPGTDPLNPEVLQTDQSWLTASFQQASLNNGYFGYTSNVPLWGPFAVTPSGMVQLAMNGLGRGTTLGGKNLWDSAETFIRDNFGNPQSSGPGCYLDTCGGPVNAGSMKDYYYGMFSFTKAMLLHDNMDGGLGNQPITLLQSLDDPGTCAAPGVPVTAPTSGSGPCYPPIDWYAAQSSAHGGTDPTDGVARTILGNQNSNGSWFGQNYTNEQNYFQTAISVIMLKRTVFNPVPVACFTTNPTHVASGGPVTLNGNCSVEQNPANTLVSWQWDVSGTGAGYSIGPGNPACLTASCSEMIATFTLPAGQSLPYSFPVKLLLTDSGNLTATVIGDVIISAPPNPPNANAGGPYNFCPLTPVGGGPLIYAPFLLDGSKSTNPDQGQTDGSMGATPSTIISYLWDYSCSGTFTSATGAQVDATAAFDIPADFGTSFNVCLQVTNNDNLAFPTAHLAAGLSSVASAQVTILAPGSEGCTHCVNTLTGKAQAPTPGLPGNIQLYWTDTDTNPAFPITHYNIYRSTSASFNPFTQIAGASSIPFIPAVQVSVPPGGLEYFMDTNVVGGTTYYYRVAPATVNDTETCQGNVTLSVTLPKGR